MVQRLLIIIVLFSIGFYSCKSKKEEPKKQVKREVVKPPVAPKDTTPPVVEKEEVVEEVIAPENKYFLIAGSFSNEKNAEILQSKLIQQGFDSEIIVRRRGVNQDFFKVSYEGFYDKKEALAALKREKQLPNKEDVWLLIK